jgi:hypothetical protein
MEVKLLFLRAIAEDSIIHEVRSAEEKNWIATNQISLDEAHAIVMSVKGNQAQSRPHHFLQNVEIWIFQPNHGGQRWYVKGFLVAGVLHVIELHLISFHPSEGQS